MGSTQKLPTGLVAATQGRKPALELMGLAKKRERRTHEEILQEELDKIFEKVEVRRYNSVSIRVRITDPAFQGRAFDERVREVYKAVSALPQTVQADITMLILLAPGEAGNPLLNYEFENPSPDRL
jgi:hypothetical protein